ncbi:MAG: hypothetical protein AB8D52_03260 [Gammaproteobacteria bacterium]
MLNIHPYQESQKLIRCKVSSEKNPSSIRYIELENYKMWEYMVTTKHGLVVETDLSLCLWVHEEEYLRNEDVYRRAGNVSSVNRLMIMINDESHGYYYSASRFVPSKETDMVKNILLSHKTNNEGDDDLTNIEVVPGYTIEQKEHAEETMTLGITTAPLLTAKAEAEIEILEEVLD